MLSFLCVNVYAMDGGNRKSNYSLPTETVNFKSMRNNTLESLREYYDDYETNFN